MANTIPIGWASVADYARHIDTPYSIVGAFITTTATEATLVDGSCGKNRIPPAHNRGSVLWPYSD